MPIGDGHSNLTFLVEREGARVVVRRPPRGPLPPSAHDVVREARLLSALRPHGTPVPEVLAICEDEAVIGAPFYVMAWVDGHVLTEETARRAGGRGERDRRVPGRRAGRPPRGRPGRRGPGRLRPCRRLPGAPAQALRRPRRDERDAAAARPRGGPRLARRQPARVAGLDRRPRRLSARQRDDGALADPPGGDPRLGDGDDRRPARRPRLHDRDVVGGRRSRRTR